MTVQQITLLLAPFALIASTQVLFRLAGRRFGCRWGYVAGFIAYWFIWCVDLPWWVLGSKGVGALFVVGSTPFGHPAAVGAVLLGAPLLLGYGYAFPRVVRNATLKMVAASALLAGVNGTLEELLWRGCYITTFHDSYALAVVFPAVGFGLWHLSPQVLRPNQAPGGIFSFVAVSIVIGLMWGWVAFSTSSIFMTSIAHVLFDFSGLGARLYFRDAEKPH